MLSSACADDAVFTDLGTQKISIQPGSTDHDAVVVSKLMSWMLQSAHGKQVILGGTENLVPYDNYVTRIKPSARRG